MGSSYPGISQDQERVIVAIPISDWIDNIESFTRLL
jgi:hypothetical protein